jgi:acyl-CoA thioester hydrolase
MPFEFKITRHVEFSETDMEGIMHFSNFFKFMETAEHAFFRSLGFSVVWSNNGHHLCLPRVHAECDYKAPLRFEDEVLVHLLVRKKSTRSLTYEFRFQRLSGPQPEEVARGKMIVVSAARQPDGSLAAVPLPTWIAARIEQAPRRSLSPQPLPSRHLATSGN